MTMTIPVVFVMVMATTMHTPMPIYMAVLCGQVHGCSCDSSNGSSFVMAIATSRAMEMAVNVLISFLSIQ